MLFLLNSVIYFEFIFISHQSLPKSVLASLFLTQAYIGKQGFVAWQCLSFSCRHAIVEGAEGVPTVLSAPDFLNTVAVKLPPFWPDNIETWLIQSESQFRLKGVTCSQTKFDYVVQAMSQSDAVKVLDLIRAPPANPYRHFTLWQIMPNMKLSPACPCLVTCYPTPWCRRCLPSFLLISRPVSSYVEPSSSVSHLMSEHT